MESYIIDWFSLIFRWLHLITGVAWIGASFYFVWLDNNLQNPPQWKKDKGIKGDLWAIHGGGIYEVAKYQLEPEQMPATLHWFKWEVYTTWVTGLVLLAIIYYLGADSYLIDKRVADLNQWQAIGLSFLVGWRRSGNGRRGSRRARWMPLVSGIAGLAARSRLAETKQRRDDQDASNRCSS